MSEQISNATGVSRGRAPRWVTMFGGVAKRFLAAGVPLGFNGLITIPGRTTGTPRTTPVAIIDVSGRRWVWAPWGDVNWVRNLRAAGGATITVRRRTEEVTATELDRPSGSCSSATSSVPLPETCGSGAASSGSSTGPIWTTRSGPPRAGRCSSSTLGDRAPADGRDRAATAAFARGHRLSGRHGGIACVA